MFKEREKLYQIYHTMLSMVLTWALALAVNQYYELRIHIVMCAFYSLVPALIVYLFDMNRKNTISYLLLFSLFPIVGLIFWIRRVNPINWSNELVGWCKSYNGSKELYVHAHATFLIVAIACLGAILFYLLMKKQIAKITLAIIIMAILIALSINKVDSSKAVIGICIFYILTIIVELYGIVYSRKLGKQDKREGILYLAPVCLLLAVLSIVLPSKPEPIQWTGVKLIYNNIKEQVEIWKTDLNYYFGNIESEFSVSITGYSEDGGELGNGGTLSNDNSVALKVYGTEGKNPIYLIGSVSDIYTGRSWEKSNSGYIKGEEEYHLDYLELIYALSRVELEQLEEEQFLQRRILKTEYNIIKTKTFFYPIKSSWMEIDKGNKEFFKEQANIRFKKVHGRGTQYQYTFYEMNLFGDAFQQVLREADTFSYDNQGSINFDSVKWIQNNMIRSDYTDTLLLRDNFYEVLKERAELIQTQYTKLPEELPNRVRELAEEIAVDYDTTFDKLKAMEAFLREYQYTLQPGQIPKDQDFTDYFLFENKKGYCTSFATAMAILGRCIGVPTRYVEGFVVTFEEKDNNNKFLVKNSQAHAWAEAYIEGVGWIPFESTAPFFSARYTKWKERTKPEDGLIVGEPNPYDQQNLQDRMGLNHVSETIFAPLPEEEETTNHYTEILNGFIILLAAFMILFLFLIIYYYALKYRYQKAFNKADYSKKMYMLFLRILRLLKREGFVLGQQETILMFSKRVKGRFYYDQVTFSEVATIFMHYRYAEEEITEKEFEQIGIYQRGLSTKQKEEKSKLWVWLEEFFFLTKKSNH